MIDKARMLYSRFFLLCLVPFSLVVGNANAFTIQLVGDTPLRWNASTVSYVVHSAGSADISGQSDLQAVQQGFQNWSNVSCTYIEFSYAGATNNRNVTSVGYGSNNVNEVVWIEASCPSSGPCWGFGPYVLGVTAPIFYSDGTIIEADIAFNGAQVTWSTSGQTGNWAQTDVLNVAAHEEGHFLGLQHVLGGYSESNPPTMAPTVDNYLKSQSIEADDQKGVCYLYPLNGSYICQSDDDCPYILDDVNGQEVYTGKITCTGGSCGGMTNPEPGDNAQGESCVSDFDCAGDLLCQSTGQGSICTTECSTSQNNCPSGFVCIPYTNAPGIGLCLPGNSNPGGGTTAGTKGPGESCAGASECASGLCVAEMGSNDYVCRESCTTTAPDCPSGESCYPLGQGTTQGACIPDGTGGNTGGGLLANGAQCTSSSECESSLCIGSDGSNVYYCRSACGLNGSPSCPVSEDCLGLTTGGNEGACIPTNGTGGTNGGNNLSPVGAPCSSPDDCASGECVSFSGDEYFCTGPCNTDDDCPCGMPCVGTNLGDLCVPGEKKGCVPDGNPCSANSECVSDYCLNGGCMTPCSVFGNDCPMGQGCAPLGMGPNGICQAKGPGLPGNPCSANSDCSTVFCAVQEVPALCSLICDPTSTSTCGPGFVCVPYGEIGRCVADAVPGTPTTGDGGPTGTSDVNQVTSRGGNAGSGCTLPKDRTVNTSTLPFLILVLLGYAIVLVGKRRKIN